MARTSTKTKVGITETEAQDAAHIYAKSSIEKDKLQAQMNEKLATVREQYQPKITSLEADMVEPVEVLKVYAVEQRNNWDGKSTELANCVIGFRTNPASVGKTKGITWDAIVGLIKANKILKHFVKVKEDVDKASILKEYGDVKISKQLQAVGIVIEQEECFYVDTKKEK
jgi:phage host-nuclease inhibitor protein Gam